MKCPDCCNPTLDICNGEAVIPFELPLPEAKPEFHTDAISFRLKVTGYHPPD